MYKSSDCVAIHCVGVKSLIYSEFSGSNTTYLEFVIILRVKTILGHRLTF